MTNIQQSPVARMVTFGAPASPPAGSPATPTPEKTQKPSPPQDRAHLSQGITQQPQKDASQLQFSALFNQADLANLQNPNAIRDALKDIGFIRPDNSYDYGQLAEYDAKTLKHLCQVFQREAKQGKDNRSLLFALRVAGANLNDPHQRQNFIRENILHHKAETHLYEMAYLQKLRPDPELLNGLKNVLHQASKAQTLEFLNKIGFTTNTTNDPDGKDIHAKTLKHLPKNITEQMANKLDTGWLNPQADIVSALRHLH